MDNLKAVAELFEGRHFDREVIILCVRALVQIADTSKKCFPFAALETSSPKHGCQTSASLALNAQSCQPELPLPDAVQQLDASNRDRRTFKRLEAQHHSKALLYTAMVLLDQVVQVFRRAQLRVCGQQAIGFQLMHRTV